MVVERHNMKILKSNESIFAMATIGRHTKPNFTIAVNPDIHRIGECYLKYYNSDSYEKATRVARISLLGPYTIIHKNKDDKKNWKLDHDDKNQLDKYLREKSRQAGFLGATNWDMTLYHWNDEFGFLSEDYSKDYDSDIEAFLSGFYDTKENCRNRSYMPSYSIQPNYLEI